MDRAFIHPLPGFPGEGSLHVIHAWMALEARYGDRCPPLWLVGGTLAGIDAVRSCVPVTERMAAWERAGRIHWWGPLDQAGLGTVLRRSLVLVAHSACGAGDAEVLAAMCQGVPVIATPHGVAKELVRDWHTGFLVDFGDVEMLARRMEHFALQPVLRAALGPRASDAARGAPPQAPPAPALDLTWFAPAYPHDASLPDDSRVRAFVERALDGGVAEVRREHAVPGHSPVWTVTADGRRWVVKNPRSLLQLRPLWDRSGQDPLVVTAAERFATDRFAGTVDGIAAVTAADADALLILRPWLAPLTRTWREIEDCAAFTRVLERIAGTPAPEAEQLRDWFDGFPDDPRDLPAFEAGVERILAASGRPWSRRHPVSVRLGWQRLAGLLAADALDLPA
ncbi:MAG TPA: glycosyltransferase, partial [Longimicrobiaceae bacterium]|nr:glycosyltransferase [Longimicrobiaceae bacterium]